MDGDSVDIRTGQLPNTSVEKFDNSYPVSSDVRCRVENYVYSIEARTQNSELNLRKIILLSGGDRSLGV